MKSPILKSAEANDFNSLHLKKHTIALIEQAWNLSLI